MNHILPEINFSPEQQLEETDGPRAEQNPSPAPSGEQRPRGGCPRPAGECWGGEGTGLGFALPGGAEEGGREGGRKGGGKVQRGGESAADTPAGAGAAERGPEIGAGWQVRLIPPQPSERVPSTYCHCPPAWNLLPSVDFASDRGFCPRVQILLPSTDFAWAAVVLGLFLFPSSPLRVSDRLALPTPIPGGALHPALPAEKLLAQQPWVLWSETWI